VKIIEAMAADIQKAIVEHGHSKLSSQRMLNDGRTVPVSWTNAEAVVTNFATKVAERRRERNDIVQGILALAALQETEQ